MKQTPLNEYLENKILEKISQTRPRSFSAEQYEKAKSLVQNFSLDNGQWKVILNKSKKNKFSEINSGSLSSIIKRLEDKHYSTSNELPTYIVQARLKEKNIDIPDIYWIEFIRDKATYINTHYEKK